MKFKRIFTIVIDSVGAGSAYDSYKYDDDKADTLGNLANATNGISLPTLEKLGLGNLHNIKGVNKVDNPLGYYTKMQEKFSVRLSTPAGRRGGNTAWVTDQPVKRLLT